MKTSTLVWLRQWKTAGMLLFMSLITYTGFAQIKILGKVTGKNGDGASGVSRLTYH